MRSSEHASERTDSSYAPGTAGAGGGGPALVQTAGASAASWDVG